MDESPNLPPDTPAHPAAPAAVRAGEAPGWERGTLEKLLFATLQEQKTARRWRTFVRLA